MLHVPASTKVIAPVDESTVQIDVEFDTYVIVPTPALGDADAVGLVPTLNAYDALKAASVKVLDCLPDDVTVKVFEDAVAEA
jgi:hypothetical protein